VDGPMARTVDDVALFLAVIAHPGNRFGEPLDRDGKGVRIGWCEGFAGLPFDSGVTEVFEASRAVFEGLGCITEAVKPDFSGADESFKVLRAAAFFARFQKALPEMKRTVIHEIERGAQLSSAEIERAVSLRAGLKARVDEMMGRYDFLVLPTTQVPAFDIELEHVSEIAGVKMESYIDWMRSCYFITMTSLPCISVPAGFTAEGLPVGLQIVGREEFAVLQMARLFEAATGHGARRPLVQDLMEQFGG
jgi:amidase